MRRGSTSKVTAASGARRVVTGWRRLAALGLLAVAATSLIAAGGQPGEPGPDRVALPIDVVDRRGEAAPLPEPADLTLEVAGGERPIAGVREASGRPIAVFFDTGSLEGANLRLASLDLSQRAEDLTSAGDVEVVVAGAGQARRSLAPSSDPTTVSEALSWTAVREQSAHRSAAARRELLADLASIDAGASDPSSVARAGLALRKALAAERLALEESRQALLGWLSENRADAGVLILVSDGVDSDARAFYHQLLESRGLEALQPELDRLTETFTGPQVEQVAAIYGWTVLPYLARSLDWSGELVLEPTAPTEGPDRGRSPTADLLAPGQGLRLDRLFGRRDEADADEPETVLVDPQVTLASLAAATGGEAVTSGDRLAALLGRLQARPLLEVDLSGEPFGRALPVKLGSREGGLELGSPGWVARGTPEVVASLRARRVLAGELADDQLLVSAALRTRSDNDRQGELAVRLITPASGEVAAPTPVGEDELRVSVLVVDPSGGDILLHRAVSAPAGATRDLTDLEIPLPGGLDSRVGIVVEEVATGRWGGSMAAAIEGEELVGSGEADEDWLLPAPRVVNLLLPEEPILMGTTRFETVVSDRDVDRVEFRVDGELEATARAPFAVVLELGRLPEPHEIEAVAFDALGRELGRDRLIVNEGTSGFRVRIVGPVVGGEAEPVVGPVDVETEIRFPREAQLDRIEYFWNAELQATRYGPPFRQQIVIPAEEPRGFVRVVAYLADGSSSEDVLLLNTPGTSERLDVDLVELYVVVSDRDGRPVLGLDSDSFTVLENGERQEIASFSDASSLPLTVGLAIDASASMFVKLPSVQRAAFSFFDGLETPRDRAFLVGFGDEPVLAQSATSDRSRMNSGLRTLRPDGQTGLWRATVFSLVQLQGIRGKKALIVYTDGADEDKDFSFRTCYKFAQRVGVPVYYILSNDEIRRTGGKGLSVRPFLNRLERLARATGGRLILTSPGDDLDRMYAEIGEELRSQYVLGYYPTSPVGDRWRGVDVAVARSGLKARTVAGYFR